MGHWSRFVWTFGPGWWDEPGPMCIAPGPPPLVPVGGLNRDQRLPFSPGSSHELGPINCLYIPLAREQSTPTALFFVAGEGRALWCSSSPPMHMGVRWNARATLLKLSPLEARPPSSIFLEICLDLAVRHAPSPSSLPSIARADLITDTTVVSLLFLSSF